MNSNETQNPSWQKKSRYLLLKDSGKMKFRQSLALRVVVVLADLVPVNDIPERF
jgi:hypothetical protein